MQFRVTNIFFLSVTSGNK